jgi:hypothetical protein
MFALIAPAHADMLDQRTELINKYINDMHADPLVADCAAHGNFIASNSGFDHVDFPPGSFDSGNATITPWNNQSFDEGKQKVPVDNVVTVSGMAASSDGTESRKLEFRCGYVGTQLLAFSWNDPRPALKPAGGVSHHSYGRRHHGRHVVKKGSKHSVGKHHVSKSKTPAKKTTVRHKQHPA